jgi:hypothetical protein
MTFYQLNQEDEEEIENDQLLSVVSPSEFFKSKAIFVPFLQDLCGSGRKGL